MNKNDKKDELNLPGYTIDNILQTGNWMTETYSDHLKQYALSIQQYQVLRSLRDLNGEPTDLLTLSAQMVSKNSNTTRLVEKLRLKKLISRVQNEENRRKVDITITDKGIALLEEIDTIQPQFETGVVNTLTESEIKTLNILLEKLRNK
ncbi:MarR family winged helix-turn-helix transcriptional regulator [Lutibacter maritimus]|uniref:HTH-type transcriptional regulator SarZ n=1 Tax=Lutibacter maritimus TaxID=593133 RepID=A0A1I6P249_9FLAO|nr:MarR family transcriptional regulator [Lutibacter maritimus]SFS34274.1 transcriptional regulator, MarR family [Lutibacter maritimus]